jgi:hypothetical protein
VQRSDLPPAVFSCCLWPAEKHNCLVDTVSKFSHHRTPNHSLKVNSWPQLPWSTARARVSCLCAVLLLLLPCTSLLPVCRQRLQQGRCTLRDTLCCAAQPQHIVDTALQLLPGVCIAW